MRRNPEKKIKKLEIAKKNLGRGDFGGSVGAQQTDKILRMASYMYMYLTSYILVVRYIRQKKFGFKSYLIPSDSVMILKVFSGYIIHLTIARR